MAVGIGGHDWPVARMDVIVALTLMLSRQRFLGMVNLSFSMSFSSFFW